MNTIDHAADVLADWADSEGGLSAIDREYDGDLAGGVEALADAGLLMPDLPEPETKPAGWESAPPGTTISEWAVDGLTRAATLPDGTILVHDDGLDVAEDPDTLESIALAYLAAVHAARQATEEA